jgi:hypothetical protein
MRSDGRRSPPTDVSNVDTAIAEGMLAVLRLANDSRRYPVDLASMAQRSARRRP